MADGRAARSVRDRFGHVVDDRRRPVPVQPVENQHVAVAYPELIQGLSRRQRGAVDAPQAPPTERRTASRKVGATSPQECGQQFGQRHAGGQRDVQPAVRHIDGDVCERRHALHLTTDIHRCLRLRSLGDHGVDQAGRADRRTRAAERGHRRSGAAADAHGCRLTLASAADRGADAGRDRGDRDDVRRPRRWHLHLPGRGHLRPVLAGDAGDHVQRRRAAEADRHRGRSPGLPAATAGGTGPGGGRHHRPAGGAGAPPPAGGRALVVRRQRADLGAPPRRRRLRSGPHRFRRATAIGHSHSRSGQPGRRSGAGVGGRAGSVPGCPRTRAGPAGGVDAAAVPPGAGVRAGCTSSGAIAAGRPLVLSRTVGRAGGGRRGAAAPASLGLREVASACPASNPPGRDRAGAAVWRQWCRAGGVARGRRSGAPLRWPTASTASPPIASSNWTPLRCRRTPSRSLSPWPPMAR